jgi:hypothetical protein
MPAARLVVVEPEFGLGGLERIQGRPATTFDTNQRLDPGPGRAPGGEVGAFAVSDGAADQQTPRPQAGAFVVVLGSVEVGQLQVGPVPPVRPPAGRRAGSKPRSLVPSPAERRCQAAGSRACAIASAVAATGGLWPQALKGCVALTPSTPRSGKGRPEGRLRPCPPAAAPSRSRPRRRHCRPPPTRTAPRLRSPARSSRGQDEAWSRR